MTGPMLQDYRILVVEDEYMIAYEWSDELVDAGAIVVGPVGTIQAALDLIGSKLALDGAVLDINLRGEMAFPAADLLMKSGIPFVFATGYGTSAIPDRFGHIPRTEKRLCIHKVIRAIRTTVHSS